MDVVLDYLIVEEVKEEVQPDFQLQVGDLIPSLKFMIQY